jgi:hypothetical protein
MGGSVKLPKLPGFLGKAASKGWLGIAGEMYEDMTTGAENEAKNAIENTNAANAKAISDAKMAQETAATQAQASVTDKKRAIARSRSVYTSPLGLSDQATTAKKTLLGA